MHCQHCNYPLWNLKTRQCPECGATFTPSSYEFVPNSVRFCCPHCDTAYYGIGPCGHLDPKRFTCVGCQRVVDMDDMVLRPAEGVDDAATRINRMPWFEREPGRFVRPWLATLGAVMFRPSTVVAGIPRDHSVVAAWAFMFFSNLIFRAIGQLPLLLFSMGAMWFIAQRIPAMKPLMPMMVSQTAYQLPVSIVMLAVMPIAWAWLAHVILRLAGAATESWRRTAHCMYFSSAANAPSAIPCGDCAVWGGAAWWTVSAIVMIKEAHRCRGGQAALAVLVSGFIVVVVGIGVALAASFLMFGGSWLNFTAVGQSMQARVQAQVVATQLTTYGIEHGGNGPAHAVQLINEQSVAPQSFCIVTPAQNVLIGGTTLQQFPRRSGPARKKAIEAVVQAQPSNVVAHRLGDMVFTYHGADLTKMDSKLWLFIVAPDPASPAAAQWTSYEVVFGDGSMSTVSAAQFTTALQQQNAYRATLGLPSLPDDLLTFPPSTPPTTRPPGAVPPAGDESAPLPGNPPPDAESP